MSTYKQHFILAPMTPDLCRACGRDPRIVFDQNNQFVVRRDDTATLNGRGLCAECHRRRDSYAHTKMMEKRS